MWKKIEEETRKKQEGDGRNHVFAGQTACQRVESHADVSRETGHAFFFPFLDSSGFLLHAAYVRPDEEVDGWKRLGRIIRRDRQKMGLGNTNSWASRIGRSSRLLLGLERGEPVGDETLHRIEVALGWPDGSAWSVLEGKLSESPADHRDRSVRQDADDATPVVAWKPGNAAALRGLTEEELAEFARGIAEQHMALSDELRRRAAERERHNRSLADPP